MSTTSIARTACSIAAISLTGARVVDLLVTDLAVFEIDRPGPQAWKQRRLRELGFGVPEWLRLVAVDFECAAALYGLGYERPADVRAFRAALESAIRSWDHDVLATSDAMMGLELALTASPDVVLVDHDAPAMEGTELVRELREVLREECPSTVLVTRRGDRAAALLDDHWPVTLLTRPYRRVDLEGALGGALATARLGTLRFAADPSAAGAIAGSASWSFAQNVERGPRRCPFPF